MNSGSPTIGAGGKVGGDLDASHGGTLTLSSAAISGNLTMGPAGTVCGTQVGTSQHTANLSVDNMTGIIKIGTNNTASCAANTITGNLEAGGNTGPLSIDNNVGGALHGLRHRAVKRQPPSPAAQERG